MKIFQEFREFAIKGNAIDMGVGIVIGAAFTSIVNSLVKDLISPFLALITSGVDFQNWFLVMRAGDKGGVYQSLADAQADNAITLNIGLFINALISFFIVAWVLFFLIRSINSLKRPEKMQANPVQMKECPFCFSSISHKATRCSACTSPINENS